MSTGFLLHLAALSVVRGVEDQPVQLDPFYVTIGVLFFAGLIIVGRHELDERRWEREREAEEASRHAAE